jgi:hypothetical protein
MLSGDIVKLGPSMFYSRPGTIRYQTESWSNERPPWRFHSRPYYPNDFMHVDFKTGKRAPPPARFHWSAERLPSGELLASVIVPNSYVVLLSGGLVFATQYQRFSLRTMLIAATFVCVVLGIAAATTYQYDLPPT